MRGQTVTLSVRYVRFRPQSVQVVLVGGALIQDFALVSGDANSNNRLDASETWTYTLTVTLQAQNAGTSHTNTATATGTDDEGRTATATTSATVAYTNVNPTIAITKTYWRKASIHF